MPSWLRKALRRIRFYILRKEWISNVSHELRTPVAVIRGHLEAWNGRKIDKGRKSNGNFKREIRRLQGMIDELFLLATQDERDAEEEAFPLDLVDVKELLKEVHETFAPIAWNERQISIEKTGSGTTCRSRRMKYGYGKSSQPGTKCTSPYTGRGPHSPVGHSRK